MAYVGWIEHGPFVDPDPPAEQVSDYQEPAESDPAQDDPFYESEFDSQAQVADTPEQLKPKAKKVVEWNASRQRKRKWKKPSNSQITALWQHPSAQNRDLRKVASETNGKKKQARKHKHQWSM